MTDCALLCNPYQYHAAFGVGPWQKHLEAWDEGSVTIATQYLFSKGEAKYSYPTLVFGTEATQQELLDRIRAVHVGLASACGQDAGVTNH